MRWRVAEIRIAHAGFALDRTVSVSVGVITVNGRAKRFGLDVGCVLNAAEEALYAAKRAGRNRVVEIKLPLAAPLIADIGLPERGRAAAEV